MNNELKTDAHLLQTAVIDSTGNLLELFAGSRCMGQEAEKLGMYFLLIGRLMKI
jgi:uncharacterized Ntn-hydrolase superfamily protein